MTCSTGLPPVPKRPRITSTPKRFSCITPIDLNRHSSNLIMNGVAEQNENQNQNHNNQNDDDSKQELEAISHITPRIPDAAEKNKDNLTYQTQPKTQIKSTKSSQSQLDGSKTEIRFGILSCAGIASKIARAIYLCPNASIVAVASRDRTKAINFIARNCPNATPCTYKQLVVHPDVDIVYIPLPSALRLAWIVKAIEQEKHILCEKPIGSPKWVEVIIPSCRAKGVQFMDGIQFMHHPRFKELTQKIHKQKIIGRVQKVISSFSVPCTEDSNIRNQPALEPLGVLGDMGVHNIRLSLWAFDYETPRFVKALCHKYSKETGSMQDVSAWLFFTSDRVAMFDCSYHCPLRQHAEIVGNRGSIFIQQFVIPSEAKCSYSTHYQTLNTYDTTEHIEQRTFTNCIQEVEMVSRMTRIAQTGKHEQFWPSVTLMTERILDACRRSINKDGALVEFVRGQLWFEMSNKEHNRKYSMVGSNQNLNQLDMVGFK